MVEARGLHGKDDVVPCLYLFASEILRDDGETVSERFGGADTRYAVILDETPLPELPRLPTLLNLHKPDRRMHLTRNAGVVRRAAVSLLRDHPVEGIVDAWLFRDRMTLLLADLRKRSVDPARIPVLRGMASRELAKFEIDEDGSFLHWPGPDVHLGVSQILQAVDPEHLARVEIERNALDYTPWALEAWRRERGIRQADVGGVSARHVRRIEQGVSRLTVSAAESFADAFGLSTREFVDELAKRTRETREGVEEQREQAEVEEPEIVVFDSAA